MNRASVTWIVEYTFKKRKKKIKVLEFFPSKKAALKFAGKCLFDVKIFKLGERYGLSKERIRIV